MTNYQYIVKYSRFGKFIIANLIGTGVGIFGGYYLDKYLNTPSTSDIQAVKKIKNNSNPTSNDNAVLDSIIEKQKSSRNESHDYEYSSNI